MPAEAGIQYGHWAGGDPRLRADDGLGTDDRLGRDAGIGRGSCDWEDWGLSPISETGH